MQPYVAGLHVSIYIIYDDAIGQTNIKYTYRTQLFITQCGLVVTMHAMAQYP